MRRNERSDAGAAANASENAKAAIGDGAVCRIGPRKAARTRPQVPMDEDPKCATRLTYGGYSKFASRRLKIAFRERHCDNRQSTLRSKRISAASALGERERAPSLLHLLSR